MREYELVYVVQPDATAERQEEVHRKVDEVIQGAEGDLLLRDDWGKRKLAYEIEKFQKGHYFQVNFLGKGPEVHEIERRLRIDSDILRYLTVLLSPEVKDIEARRVEAQEQAAEQARRRAEREKEREERERREAAAAARDDDGGGFERERPVLGPPTTPPAAPTETEE